MYNNELYHFGVKGMKWGVRRARGHAGPGRYLTKKRQQAGDKRDLERLNKGQHLSVGLTKKRQAKFDARDKAAIEKRMNENGQSDQPKKKGLSDKQKTALKVGAAAAGTALAAYGAYKLHNYIREKNVDVHLGRDAADNMSMLKENLADWKARNLSASEIKARTDRFNRGSRYVAEKEASKDTFRTAAKNVYDNYKANRPKKRKKATDVNAYMKRYNQIMNTFGSDGTKFR